MPYLNRGCAIAAGAAAMIAVAAAAPHAHAHHCGKYGTHTKDGWCLKKKPPHWPKYPAAQSGGIKAKSPGTVRKKGR